MALKRTVANSLLKWVNHASALPGGTKSILFKTKIIFFSPYIPKISLSICLHLHAIGSLASKIINIISAALIKNDKITSTTFLT